MKKIINSIIERIKLLLGWDKFKLEDEIIEAKLIAAYNYHGGVVNEYQSLGYDYLYTWDLKPGMIFTDFPKKPNNILFKNCKLKIIGHSDSFKI